MERYQRPCSTLTRTCDLTLPTICKRLRFIIDRRIALQCYANSSPFIRLYRITGTIPAMFCGEDSYTMLYQEFGCDAVLCPPGTFSPHGHATLHSACRKCPITEAGESSTPPLSQILGRTSCDTSDFIIGDLNGDGILSPREILRMLYIETVGRFWGVDFLDWADMKVHECNLKGITCVNEKIVKIDLMTANMCMDGNRRPLPRSLCTGIPSEIGELSELEIIQLNRRQYLHGSIPTEIGKLTKLKWLDLSGCMSLTGTLPTEMGLLTSLRFLKIAHSQIKGTIPAELFVSCTLEILHLTNNKFTGQLPPPLSPWLKELMVARNRLTGTIPTEIGFLTVLENFEAYHNEFSGSIPKEIGDCTALKRIGKFPVGFEFIKSIILSSLMVCCCCFRLLQIFSTTTCPGRSQLLY